MRTILFIFYFLFFILILKIYEYYCNLYYQINKYDKNLKFKMFIIRTNCITEFMELCHTIYRVVSNVSFSLS